MKYVLYILLVILVFKFLLNLQEIQEWDDFIIKESIIKLEFKCLQIFFFLRQLLSLIKYKVIFQIYGIKYFYEIKKV